jgi:hypothetical protein
LGDGTILRSSSSNSFSVPPLKKNVTCAYFSVSATSGADSGEGERKLIRSRIRTGDVVLRDVVLGEPLGEDVVHGLRRVQHGEGELGLVLREREDPLRGCREKVSPTSPQ